MRTLIITSSEDITTDLLINKLGSENVFRFNTDLFFQYKLEVSDQVGFCIKDPTERKISLKTTAKVYWRKPVWPKLDPGVNGNERYLIAEIKHIVWDIFNISRAEKKTVLVDPLNEKRISKIFQLKKAQKFFKIPKYKFVYPLKESNKSVKAIVKSLSGEQMENNDFLFSTEININQLDKMSPWFIQEKISADYDVTVVFVKGKIFAFSLERSWLIGVDWRAQLNDLRCKWNPFLLNDNDKSKIRSFMKCLNLEYGRIDFLWDCKDLYFLEVNQNGQFAWLDFKGENGLLDAILTEISPQNI